MKSKTILLLIFFLSTFIFSSLLIDAQTTSYPTVEQSNADNIKIASIAIERNRTEVTIEYEKKYTTKTSDRNQEVIWFTKNTFLSDFYNERDLYQIESVKDNQLETRYILPGKKGDKYYFTLIFPPLPQGLQKINVKEYGQNGVAWEWRGITINNPDNSPKTNWTESSLKVNWEKNGMDLIEGIYENTVANILSPKYKLAVKKSNDGYDFIYLSGAENDITGKWKVGAIKGSITKTAKENFYKARWLRDNKSVTENLYVTFEEAVMKLIWTDGSPDPEQHYLKLYPLSSSTSSQGLASSGTGFALSSNGLIVTNYHVVEGGNNISVKGINGNFSVSYKAKVLVSDKNNDLSIIQITDNSFSKLGRIPYSIKSVGSNVGESVFVLGYPLRASMGDEIKLTNGIISSKTGFQGDVTSYQISAPIQPGNSGGPLFDKDGNLIGVINAKLRGGENVSYAIKVSYLRNLIDLLPTTPTLSTESTIKASSLSDQVQVLNKYVYIIEVN